MRREYSSLNGYMSTRICENAFKTISCFRRNGRTVESTFEPQSESRSVTRVSRYNHKRVPVPPIRVSMKSH